MSAGTHFDEQLGMSCQKATMESIARYCRSRLTYPPFDELFSEEYVDANVGAGSNLGFSELSLDECESLKVVIDAMSKDFPAAISNWHEHRRPVFYMEFGGFRVLLDLRIIKLRQAASGASADH